MKANHKSLWTRDTRAQVGIGTMIVFIATILVAATAAAVLIDTSGKLSERSSSTGNEATKQVASNLIVQGVYGTRAASTDDIQDVYVKVALAAGATPVDLAEMKILFSDGDIRNTLDHSNTCAAAADDFCATEIRDPENTFTAGTAYVISKGGLFDIHLDLPDANGSLGVEIAERTSVTIILIPEVGAPVHADFTTPASFGDDLLIHLR